MATAVEVPKLGNTVEECIVAKWLKRKGEKVSAGETVAEIETDKATFEVAATVDGTLIATFFEEGALVPVFTNLFVIGEPGESVEPFRPGAETADRSLTVAAQSTVMRQSETSAAPIGRGAMSPRARRFAHDRDFQLGPIVGSGPGGRVLEEDVRSAYFASPRVSPAAKRRIEDGEEAHGEGSGAAGMIRSTDLGAAATRISGVREKIARRLRESLASTAQYTLNGFADASALLVLRARIKALQGVPDININDVVTFCTIQALLQMPELNAEFRDGRIYKHTAVHIGFACDTPRGLMVPVVRNAQSLPIGELAIKMKELTAQAVAGTVAVDDLSGATFTISNLGGLGIETFTPVLNPPQVAILGVGSITLKPVRKQGRIEFIDAIGLSLTCDHQVIDGAPGARFLQVLREKIEDVESLCTI